MSTKKKTWWWCFQHFSDSRSLLDKPVWLMSVQRGSGHSEPSSWKQQEAKLRQFWCLFWNWYQFWISEEAKPLSEVAFTGQIKKYLIPAICILKRNSRLVDLWTPKEMLLLRESHNTSFYHVFTVLLRISFWRTNQQKKEMIRRLWYVCCFWWL